MSHSSANEFFNRKCSLFNFVQILKIACYWRWIAIIYINLYIFNVYYYTNVFYICRVCRIRKENSSLNSLLKTKQIRSQCKNCEWLSCYLNLFGFIFCTLFINYTPPPPPHTHTHTPTNVSWGSMPVNKKAAHADRRSKDGQSEKNLSLVPFCICFCNSDSTFEMRFSWELPLYPR